MKKRSLGLLAFAGLLTVAGAAHAAGVWTAYGQIVDFEDYGVGPVLALDSAAQNPAGCPQSGGRYVMYAGLSEQQKDRLSRTALAAHMAGVRVKLKILSGAASTACTEGYPSYYAIDLDKP